MKIGEPELDKYLLGSVLFLALLVGGGTMAGLYTDSLLQVAAILASARVIARPSSQPTDPWLVALALATMAIMALQLVPLPGSWLAPLRPQIFADTAPADQTAVISLGGGRTVECMLFMAAILAFLFALLQLRSDQLRGLLPFFFMGVICNVLAGAVEYSLASSVAIDSWLPYTITAGFFANANHFSSLLFVSIPFIVFYAVFRGHIVIGVLGLAAVLLLLLAAGSRAGVLIGLAITAISLVFLLSRTRSRALAIMLMFLFISVYTVGAWSKIGGEVVDTKLGRHEMAATTITGIEQNWPVGIGFGNFQGAYQIYEKPEMIFRQYVNHAHNDYLEIVFEGGIAAALLLVLYMILLVMRSFAAGQDPFKKAAILSIVFLLVHTLVDYPLRTVALALCFAYFNAILFHRNATPAPRRASRRAKVEPLTDAA